jgi:Class III cytochrome C family
MVKPSMSPAPSPNRKRVDRFIWNRGYFHKPTYLARWKFRFSALAVVVAGGWLLFGQFALPEETRHYRYTHGAVAGPHAAWDGQCSACHQSFSTNGLELSSLPDVHDRWREFRCETCHHGPAGDPKNYAVHHADAIWNNGTSATDCSACHHDHQGRNFSLVKLPDSACTQCHRELKEHHNKGEPQYLANIGRFEGGRDDSHPPFRNAGPGVERPRTLHFNHAIHMLPGMASPEALANKSDCVWTIGKIREIDKKYPDIYRLPGQTDNDPVVLSCSSCHELDAGRISKTELLNMAPEASAAQQKLDDANDRLVRNLPRDAVRPPRAGGAHMLPIVYEKHCSACHSIDTGPVALDQAGFSFKSFPVPHRTQPGDLEDHLRREFISGIVKSLPAAEPAKELESRQRLDQRVDADLKKLRGYEDIVQKLVGKAKEQLYIPIRTAAGGFGGKNCLKCHEAVAGTDGKKVLEIVRPNTPAIWFEHASFDHSSHRAMNCTSCHPIDGRPVLVPGIDNCRQCHAPSQRIEINGTVETRGGVRHDCVDCHRYHNGDFSLQGIGSPHRDPPADRRLETGEFLRGSRRSTTRETP